MWSWQNRAGASRFASCLTEAMFCEQVAPCSPNISRAQPIEACLVRRLGPSCKPLVARPKHTVGSFLGRRQERVL